MNRWVRANRDVLGAAIDELVGALGALGRDHLARRAMVAGDRLRRPEAVVLVVGDAGFGKSSLVDGLVGSPVCQATRAAPTAPVAPVVTVVRFGEAARTSGRRRIGELCAWLLPEDREHGLIRLADDLEHHLRTAIDTRLAELHRTFTETAEGLRQIADQAKEQAKRRSTEIAAADAVLAKVAALAGPPATDRRAPEPTRR